MRERDASRRRSTRVALARVLGPVFVLLAAACGSGGAAVPRAEDVRDTAADFSYRIEAGTGARIERGETVDVVPARLHARVGQVIRIENLDDRGHLVGPFFVGVGETLTQRFTAAGVLQGGCSVHPSGTMTVVVDP